MTYITTTGATLFTRQGVWRRQSPFFPRRWIARVYAWVLMPVGGYAELHEYTFECIDAEMIARIGRRGRSITD